MMINLVKKVMSDQLVKSMIIQSNNVKQNYFNECFILFAKYQPSK